MKKLSMPILAGMLLLPIISHAASPLVGMYQTIDDKTNQPKSIVALYEYADGDDTELAGRIVALYGPDGAISETIANPVKVASGVPGAPKYAGLDIIWGMEWDDGDNRYTDGRVMDPTSGKTYSSVIWQETPGQINVRGKIGPIGRTQNWRVIDMATMPAEIQNIDTSNWTPNIRTK